MIGQTISHYRIVEKLGAGGMGEVFRAEDTPAVVRSLLRRCLQKDPDRRVHDIADARIEMQEETGLPAETMPVPRRPRLWRVMAAYTTTLVIGVSLGAVGMKYFKPASPPASLPVVRAAVRIEPGHWLDGWRFREVDQPTRTAMAISSDGRFILYSAIKENPGPQDKPRLYLRRLEQVEARPIAGTEGGISPFLSPDDRWVGFWADGKLKKVSVDGGVPAVLCDVSAPFGFSWGDDNRIVFASAQGVGLSRIPADGGKPETLTVPDISKEEQSHRLPHCLAAGKGTLFTIMRHLWELQPRVAVLELGTGKWRVQSLWSRNRKQLFYRRLNGVWVVDIQTGSAFSASKPRRVFEQPGYEGIAPVRTWDISCDDQRFLMVKLGERKSQPVTELILVQNWFEQVKRLVPTGRRPLSILGPAPRTRSANSPG